jgi:hypothetical protein
MAEAYYWASGYRFNFKRNSWKSVLLDLIQLGSVELERMLIVLLAKIDEMVARSSTRKAIDFWDELWCADAAPSELG